MMKLLVVDDEPLARARIVALLKDYPGIDVIVEATNGIDAIKKQQEHSSNVILMDIRMPGMDGLEAAGHLSRLENPPVVIFTTAYDDHALDAFDLNAIGYLLKPVQKERLHGSLQTANRLKPENKRLTPTKPRQFISATVAGSLQMLPITDILFFRAEQKYVIAHHAGGELLLEETLKQLESELADRFIRIHRSTLVALDKVSSLDKHSSGQTVIAMQGDVEPLEVSRRHLPLVRKRLKELSKA